MNENDRKLIEQFNANKNFPHVSFAILITLGIIFVSSIIEGMLFLTIPGDEQQTWTPYIIGFGQVVFMLVPTFIAARYSPIELKVLFRLNTSINIKQVAIALIGLAAIQFFFYGYDNLQEMLIPEVFRDTYNNFKKELNEIYYALLGGETVYDAARAITVGAILPAVIEEFLFRGLLYGALRPRLGAVPSIALSAAVFAAFHFNLYQFLPILVIGVTLAYLYEKTRSLVTTSFVHILHNSVSVAFVLALKYAA